ncbi:uncharacterized protein [Miscanthus floridulus]|uniref:uncharacterized protein isoform X3 n=1 Tax=Miscanthus floridulus TaxID=154761 RepID=UPI00345941C8
MYECIHRLTRSPSRSPRTEFRVVSNTRNILEFCLCWTNKSALDSLVPSMVMGHGCLGLSVRKGKCRAACIFDFRRPLFGFLQSQLFRTDHLLEINTEKRIRGCFSLVHRDSSCRPLKQRSVVAERKRSRSPSMSSLLSRLRLVTVDVTGTLIAYRGQLGDYYCMAAKSAGMPCPDYGRVHEGFKLAYADMSRRHPCFGHAAAMPTADWWKTCVRDSFVRAGYG